MFEKILAAGCTLLLAAPAFAQEGHGAEAAVSPFAGDLGNAIWTVVIFAVVLVVLGKFAWGPILGALQKREDFIRESLAQAKSDRDEAEVRRKEFEDRLAQARAEASALVDEGRRDADVVKRRIEADARAEAEKIVARGKREIEIATDTALQEIYALASRLTTEVASKVVGRELTPQDHERLIAESIAGLSKATSSQRAH